MHKLFLQKSHKQIRIANHAPIVVPLFLFIEIIRKQKHIVIQTPFCKLQVESSRQASVLIVSLPSNVIKPLTLHYDQRQYVMILCPWSNDDPMIFYVFNLI